MTKQYQIRGKFPAGCEGYHIGDYASAAGVELMHDSRESAEAAAREIETTPDVDGIAPSCDVYEVEQ